jgi:hypothetical protein
VFHLAAWQVIFFTALVIGVHRRKILDKLQRVSPALGVAITLPLLLASIVFFHFRYQVIGGLFPDRNADAVLEFAFGKGDLRPGRLLEFTIIAFFAFSAVTLLWRPLHRAVGWLLLPLGQNSLAAYTFHMALVAGAAKATTLVLDEPTRLQNTLVQVIAVALVWVAIRVWPAMTALPNLMDATELNMIGEARDAVLSRVPVLILPLRRGPHAT